MHATFIASAGKGDVFADGAHRGQHFAAAMRGRGGVPRIAVTSKRGQDETATLARPHPAR